VTDDRHDDPLDDSLLDLPLGPGDDRSLGDDRGSGDERQPGPFELGLPGEAEAFPGDEEPSAGAEEPSAGAEEPSAETGQEASGGPRRRSEKRSRLTLFLILALVLVVLLALAGLAGYLLPRPSPALVRVAPTVVDFGARSVAGSGGSTEVTLSSNGERPAEIDSVEVVLTEGAETAEEGDGDEASQAPAGAFRVASDACSGATVSPGKTCVVAVAFAPQTAGAVRAVLRLDGDFANAPLDVPLLGEGVAPHLRVDRERLDFGARPAGSAPAEQVVMLENDGTAPLDLDAVVVTGADAGEFTVASTACTGKPLKPGASCPVSVAFAPTGEGARTAALTIRPGPGARGLETPAVALTGTGLPREPSGRLRVESPAGASESGLGFGAVAVGRGSDRTVRLSNGGDRALEGEALAAVVDGDAFAVGDNGCAGAGSLAPGATCELVVRFAPTEEGEAKGVLRVGVPAGREPGEGVAAGGLELSLRGRGVVPRLVPRPGTVDFGESRVGQGGPTREVTLASTGSGAVEISGAGLAGPDPGAFAVSTDDCAGKTLAPGESCQLQIGFQPRQEGVQSARLEIRSPVLDGAVTVALRGAGAASRIALSPRSLSFDRVPATRSATRSLTVTSAGRAPLEIRRIDVVGRDAAAFAVTGEDCTEALSLAPGDTCRVTVRFAPSAEGEASAHLSLAHDGEGSPTEVPVSGTALPAPVPRFEVTPRRVAFGAVAVGGRSGIETVTVRNTGSERLVLGDVRLAGAGAGAFQVVPGSCEGAPFISPGSECTIGVRFTPTAAGSDAAELVIRHNAAGGRGQVRLEGTGSGGAGSP